MKVSEKKGKLTRLILKFRKWIILVLRIAGNFYSNFEDLTFYVSCFARKLILNSENLRLKQNLNQNFNLNTNK